MEEDTCIPMEPLRSAVAAFRAASDADSIAAEAIHFREIASKMCQSVAVLIDMAIYGASVEPLFLPEANALPIDTLKNGRDGLLEYLRKCCLYCGGMSPFAD